MKHLLLFTFILFLVNPLAFAQHAEQTDQAEHREHLGNTHKLTVVMANSFLKNDFEENPNSILIVPTYGFHLPNHWELGFMLEFDRKISTYNSWVFGVGFSKLLMRK